MLKTLRKLFKLPTPKELGISDSNALTCRDLTPFQDGPSWDDYDNIVRKKHPIRFFLGKTVPYALLPIQGRIERAWYWVQCHTLPSYRFHKLDFRGVDPLSEYTHGYMDPCGMMQLAAWAALRIYVEKELIHEGYDSEAFTKEEREAEWFKEQKRQRYDEPMALYKYWMEGRRLEREEADRLYEATKVVRRGVKAGTHTKEDYDAVSKPWTDHGRECEAREQEMFMKLCALREYLWT